MQTTEPTLTTAKQKPSTKAGNKSAGTKSAASPSKPNKTETILNQLRTKDGASIEDLIKASGWQAHSVRGFLSGTVKKKRGLELLKETDDKGVRRYRITEKKSA